MRYKRVIESVYDPIRLRMAWQQVKKNTGEAGIDQKSIEDFDERKDELLLLIHEKLKAEIYRFRSKKRILNPKKGSSKIQKLEIPLLMDQIVMWSIKLVMIEAYDQDLTKSLYSSRRSHC